MAKLKVGNSKKLKSNPKEKSEDLGQLEKIFELMEKHEVTELEWDRGVERLKVKTRHAAQAQPREVIYAESPVINSARPSRPETSVASSAVETPKSAATNSNQKQVVSPFVGTFYRSSSPDSDPYVREGQVVKRGDVLCIIEAMKLMNEIEVEIPGKIISVLVENGQPVEFGEPLFVIEP